MPIGKIKWFNSKKGYGFITEDGTDKDIFLHVSSLEESKLRSITEGQKLKFEIKTENNKLQATKLKKSLNYIAGWSSLVARQAHNLKVGGSNPSPATKFQFKIFKTPNDGTCSNKIKKTSFSSSYSMSLILFPKISYLHSRSSEIYYLFQ